jgi:3-hydroxyisobutyrate dehydrogenase-like beta-hydroxyacid dehydrogenase
MTVSRRSLLGGGAALAGVGVIAALTPGSTEPVAAPLTAADLEALDIPVILSVTDASNGHLEVLVGEQAIAFTDRNLVAKLAKAARMGDV